jgi:hypothetical protein
MTTTGGSIADGPEMRLATYGTLAPGRPNHAQLSDLAGRWLVGHVRGTVVEAGWGAKFGYPGLILDPDEPVIAVNVFESRALLHFTVWTRSRVPAIAALPSTSRLPRVSWPRRSTSWRIRPPGLDARPEGVVSALS